MKYSIDQLRDRKNRRDSRKRESFPLSRYCRVIRLSRNLKRKKIFHFCLTLSVNRRISIVVGFFLASMEMRMGVNLEYVITKS